MNSPEALAMLQAAAEYAARPRQILVNTRSIRRTQNMPKSH